VGVVGCFLLLGGGWSSKIEPGASSLVWGVSRLGGLEASVSLRRVARAAGSRVGSLFNLKGLRLRREIGRRWE